MEQICATKQIHALYLHLALHNLHRLRQLMAQIHWPSLHWPIVRTIFFEKIAWNGIGLKDQN